MTYTYLYFVYILATNLVQKIGFVSFEFQLGWSTRKGKSSDSLAILTYINFYFIFVQILFMIYTFKIGLVEKEKEKKEDCVSYFIFCR